MSSSMNFDPSQSRLHSPSPSQEGLYAGPIKGYDFTKNRGNVPKGVERGVSKPGRDLKKSMVKGAKALGKGALAVGEGLVKGVAYTVAGVVIVAATVSAIALYGLCLYTAPIPTIIATIVILSLCSKK